MRRILCEKCLRKHLPVGVRMIHKSSNSGPAEYQRLILGTALDPTKEIRTVYVNGAPKPLPMGMLNCDSCNLDIFPEAVCAAWSVWREDMQPVPEWEEHYLKPITQTEYEKWKQVTARLEGAQKAK